MDVLTESTLAHIALIVAAAPRLTPEQLQVLALQLGPADLNT
jgi:hypothetical protein